MRNKLFLGLVLATGALTGCDKLWAWKLVDCPLSDSRCTGDGGADTPDLIGADLAGSGGREDLAGVDLLGSKPSFVSIAPTSAGGSQVLIGTNRGKVVSCELSNAQNSEGVVLDAEDPGVRAVAARRFFDGGSQVVLAALSSGDVWKDVSGSGSSSERKLPSVLAGGWYESFESMYPNQRAFWVAGSGGLVALRHSGDTMPVTWTTESTGVTTDLYALTGVANTQYMTYDPQKTRLYAVGASGTVLERLSGAWTSVTSIANRPTTALYGVAVYSNDVAMPGFDMATGPSDFVWAVGEQGRLVRKRGTTWSALPSGTIPTTVTLRAVFLNSTTTGLAVGDRGAVYTLGGNEASPTWTEVVPPASVGGVDPRTIHFTGLYYAYVNFQTSYYLVGSEGTVMRYVPPPTNMWQLIPCPTGQ